MSGEHIVARASRAGIVGLAIALCMALSGPSFGADFDKKPTGFTLVGPTAKDALSDAPTVVSAPPTAPGPAASTARALPQGLPNASAPTASSVVKVDTLPPPAGPLGLKTPRPVVDATHDKPDYYPLLPGIYGRPDNNVGMVLGVVLPISPKEK
jgi:hypothetical protein